MRTGTAFVLALLGLLLAQSVFWAGAEEREARRLAEAPLLPGDHLPEIVSRIDGSRASYPEGCWHGYMADSGCAACRSLLEQWPAAPGRASAMWVFLTEDSTSAIDLTRSAHVTPDSLLFLDAPTLRHVGVFATPTFFTARGSQVLSMWIASSGLVPSEEAHRECTPVHAGSP